MDIDSSVHYTICGIVRTTRQTGQKEIEEGFSIIDNVAQIFLWPRFSQRGMVSGLQKCLCRPNGAFSSVNNLL